MDLLRKVCRCLAAVSLSLLIAACAPLDGPRLRGVNLLQTREVALDAPLAAESFRALRATGANTVALVPFLHLPGPRSLELGFADAVTDAQLVGGIRHARMAGLMVIVKPQILVDGAWAGAIEPESGAQWGEWFVKYGRAILHYAEIAQREQAEVFVVGTELKQADGQPHWRPLIESVRKVYRGRLTYAAHNLDGVEGFRHWDLLDRIGVTLYPPLGPSAGRDNMGKTISAVTAGLEGIAARHGKPVLVAEIGIAAARGAQMRPWERPERCGTPADAGLQAEVLGLWLDALRRPWVDGVLVWNWYSDPYAGGRFDTDFTVQNKPAQAALGCRWAGECR